MNIHDQFPAKWIEPDDFGDRSFALEITGCELVEVFNKQTNSKEKKLAVSFKGAKKRLLLNKTQAFAIAKIAGSDDTDAWRSKGIVLRAGVARNGKGTIVVDAPAVATPVAALQTEEVA